MATELFAADRATTTVSSGGTDAPSSGTTETWTVVSSSMFGAAATGVSQFHVADANAPTEIIAVTNVSGTTWTVTRGADSTTPVTHSAGFTIYQVVPYSWLSTLGPGTGTVTSVTATDTSIVVSGTPTTAPTLATGTLDVIATQHPPAGNWSNNSHKITSVANGSSAQDAATFGQVTQILTQTSVQTANYAASANQLVRVDTTSGSITVTLPNAPAAGTLLGVKQVTLGGTNTVTVACAGSDVFNKSGGGTSLTLTLQAQGTLLQYGSGIWYIIADDLPLSQLDARYLALAGGTLTGSLAVGGALGTTPSVLTDAATITVNAALSDYFRVTLGGNRTLGTPTNPTDGQRVTIEVIQPGSGGPYTLSYSGAYSFPASVPQPTLSTAANDHDFISFVYNSALTLWTCTGYVSAQNSGLVTIAQGGTGQTTAAAGYNALSPMTTTGDLEYESGTNTAARLAGNTSATKNFLTQTGSGSASAAPAWGAIAAGDVPYDATTSHIHLPGTQTAGANSQVTDSGHVHPATGIIPSDHGLLAWSFDITGCGNGTTLIAGTVYLVKIPIRYALTATNLWFSATSAGSGVSTGSFVGLYSSAGSLLSGSSDLGTSIAAGNHQVALTTPQALSAGTFVWAAILSNQASSQPGLLSPLNFTGSVAQNLNLTAATFRIAVPSGGTSQTTLPGSFTPSSNTNTGAEFLWFGIS